ncbi:MAG: EcsC family protein [bacterium]|jgi:uncharacterized protein (DUF697 family)|nr:EcsC family protein [bacterium]
MTPVAIEIPWLFAVCLGLLAIIGGAFLLHRGWQILSLYLTIHRNLAGIAEAQQHRQRFLTNADQKALVLIDTKVRETWRTFGSVQWTNLHKLRDESLQLVQDIAAIYYPSSKRPVFEITLVEILRLHERITQQVQALIAVLPALHQFSIASLLEAKSILDQTKTVLDKKSIRSGKKIATRVWLVINSLNPQYWVNKALFHGASEVVGRKVLTSIFRIIGTEAMQVYRSSSAIHADQAQFRPVDESAPPPQASEPQIPPKPENAPKTEPPHFAMAVEAEPMDIAEENSIVFEPEILLDEKPSANPTSSESDMETPSQEPKSLKQRLIQSITDALTGFIEGSLHQWEKWISPQAILNTYQKKGTVVQSLEEIRPLPLSVIDPVADHYIKKGEWLCAAEGAATGVGGAILLAADAVSLLVLQLRTIQQIGLCYGFDVNQPEERLFAVKLLAEAYQHPALKERDSLLKEMRFASNLIQGKTPIGLLRNRFFIQGFAKVAEKIGLRMGTRKVTQFIPVLGAVTGGIINKKVTKDIALIAKEIYRTRLQEQNQKENP